MSKIAAIIVAISGTASAFAQVSYTGGSYLQNFDTLSSAGTTSTWTNNTTLPGWFLFHRTSAADATPVATVTLGSNNGGSNTGNWYSYGATGSGERALGGLASSNAAAWGSPATGAVAGWMAVAFTNGGSDILTDISIAFDGEQWRDGGATAPAAQSMVLEYGFGATFAGVATWTPAGASFNWSSPVFTNTGAGAAVDGNGAGLVTGRGGSVASLTWNPGDTLWVRWIENNDSGNDHGLAIDNFSFSATPTPGAAALLGLGALVAGRRRRA